ncbi:MAG: hypothetical protein KBC27_02185 [Rickettsiales bacterium]|nr:hypothetical protein [Rickettsiales bacterium]
MSSKTSLGKEYQGNIFQFFIFLISLVIYLFLYDNSLERFLQDIKYVIDLNFTDHHFLNSIFWIVGFWGMIVLLNLQNVYLRSIFWILLIFSSMVNFVYLKIEGKSFSYLDSGHFSDVILKFFDINTAALVKFIAINAVMVSLAFILKPLSVSLNKVIVFIIIIVVLLSFALSNGQSLQGFYLVPAIFCYKYLLILFAWIKTLFVRAK